MKPKRIADLLSWISELDLAIKQEIWILLAIIAGAGALFSFQGCQQRAISPFTGQPVTLEQLNLEAGLERQKLVTEIASLQAKATSLESALGSQDSVVGAARDIIEVKEDRLAAIMSGGVEVARDTLLPLAPLPLQGPLNWLLGSVLGFLAPGYVRKELQLRRDNRRNGVGPRGEKLPE